MSTLNEFLTFEYENEHDLAHDLPQKRFFSTPKIYSANGDIGKRWYVYFSYRNPDTGRLARMKTSMEKQIIIKPKKTDLPF